MTKRTKVLVYTALSLMFCFIGVGYAALTTTLQIDGSANIVPPVYDEIVITNITEASGTTATQENSWVPTTSVSSTISGATGQKIVYKITAHNYSETVTYVYSGTTCSSDHFDAANSLKINVSSDQAGNSIIPSEKTNTYTVGTPIAPGEDFVFYATYTLTDHISEQDLLVKFNFDTVIYSVTYLNDNEIYSVDCITDNSVAYNVTKPAPSGGTGAFMWVDVNANKVTSYPKNNTHSYTLSSKWENEYLIIFADADGTVLYEEKFTESSTSLSAEGQTIVAEKLAELNANAQENIVVSWENYDIKNAKSDITVRAIYNYSGYLNLVPKDNDNDGIIDEYEVHPVDDLPEVVEVPGYVGNVPVKEIERITNIDGENDWNNFERDVKTIILNEGTEILGWNSLAWTPNLATVYLPNSLQSMGKNVFSRNIALGGFGQGDDKKVLNVEFNGTKAEWKAILANSDSAWAGGLKEGSIVRCSDGYFKLQKAGFFGSLTWYEY